jgi:hypothetical protein
METFVSSCRPLQWAKHKERGYLSAYLTIRDRRNTNEGGISISRDGA